MSPPRKARSLLARPSGPVAGRVVRNETTKDPRGLVDGGRPSAVDTPAAVVPVRVQIDLGSAASGPSAMEKEHFGNCLRRERERRDFSLSDVAQKTKVSRSVLEQLERGDLDLLPAGVYARGFIRSFARAIGADEVEPLLLYDRAVDARIAAEQAKLVTPVPDAPFPLHHQTDDESSIPRRGLGLAVFVIILLLIATITLSLLLRRPPPSGEGLSFRSPAGRSVEALATADSSGAPFVLRRA